MANTSLSFSSTLNPAAPAERARVSHAPSQGSTPAATGINLQGYSYASNAGPSSPVNFNSTLNDGLAQSRPQYQPGYLLSLAQNQSFQPTQRHEETHLIQTRAKMNPGFPRNASTDFGTESMFETVSKHRHHESAGDDDAPPLASVIDIISDVPSDSYRLRPPSGSSTLSKVTPGQGKSGTLSPHSSHPVLYIIVFGYPPSRYSSTAAHFQQMADGGTTEPQISLEVDNAFKIGYKQPWEAARAWQKNGEILNGEGGRWMVGVKWVDPLLAEQVIGSVARNSVEPLPSTTEIPVPSFVDTSDPTSRLNRGSSSLQESTSSIGTPLKLAPSTMAFKKIGTETPIQDTKRLAQGTYGTTPTGSPSKGVLGQVSDLIFGW